MSDYQALRASIADERAAIATQIEELQHRDEALEQALTWLSIADGIELPTEDDAGASEPPAAAERPKQRGGRKPGPIEHGNPRGYKKCAKRPEGACKACQEANREYHRRQYAARKAAVEPAEPTPPAESRPTTHGFGTLKVSVDQARDLL